MASIQRFSSHGSLYWRIVQSYRRPDGKPTVRVLAHLGKADDLLARLNQQRAALRVHSVASGAVDAAWSLATELGFADAIDASVKPSRRGGLSVGQSITAAAIARLIHPSSKRAIAEWASGTSLPAHLGVPAKSLSSQHFWDQMDRLPAAVLPGIEQNIVARLLRNEAISPGVLAYDTTNFFTHIDSTNDRATLPQRGHNKQRRHDLRQLGLALVVSVDGQIPLTHRLYSGASADVRVFAELLAPLHKHLGQLAPQPEQLTLVFDQGAESQANLAAAGELHLAYVTALKPSHHRDWLRHDAERLTDLTLSGGALVRAYRSNRLVHGIEQTVVTVYSESLAAGQRRGLDQQLAKAFARIARISAHPRDGKAGIERQIERILNRQYLREILSCRIHQDPNGFRLEPLLDAAKREHLEAHYFGLRLLATSRQEWSTAQIIEAYRGQSKVESAFRDLKDPWVASFRPQFHWTDQKLQVHAFIAILSLLLGRVLLRRAQALGFTGSMRSLITTLSQIRTATLIEQQPGSGRPKVIQQTEELSTETSKIAIMLLPKP